MFQDLFNKIQIPLMITNSDGKIVFINDAGKKVAEDVTGSSLYQYLPAAYESIVKEYTFSPKAFMSKQAAEKVEIMVNGSLKTADMTVLDEQHLLFQWNHSLTTFEKLFDIKETMTNRILDGGSLLDILTALSDVVKRELWMSPHYSLVLLEDKNKAADVISPTLTECLYPRLNGRRLTKEDGLHGETVLANRPSFVYDLSENEKLRNYYHFLSSYDIRSIWCEPIVIDGNIVGIFTMYHNAPSAPTEHDIKLLNVCSCLIALAVRHTKMKEKWEQVEKQEYEMIAHYAGDAITVLNKEGCIIYASPSHLPITGYSGDELEQKNVLDYIDPDDRPEVEEKISCLHESKQEGYLEVRFRRKDGTYITVACNAKPVLKGNNKGDIYRFIVISRDITEQKIAEKKLEESEQHYKSLFYYNANPVALLDLDGKITSTNGPLEKLLSFHKEEFNGYYRQYIHPDYIESTDGYFQRAVNGEAVTYETVGLDKNGQPVYLLITNIPVILGGKTVGVYCIVNDITDKKLAQERLRESEEELRALLNSMPEFVIFQDKDGRLIELNESAKQLLSYRQTQTGSPGMLNPESFSQVEKSEWVKKDKEAWEKGEFIQYEQQMVHSDGKPRTYEIVKAPQFSDNNEKKYMVTIGRDISVRKEMEGELKETKELLEAVFNNSADAILIIKLNGELLKANPAFYSLYGYSPDDSNILQTNLIPEELREETNALLERVKKGEKVVDYETKRKTKNRELFEVSITYSPIRDKHGNISGISAISRDIRDRKKTEELLRRSEKLSVIGQLAAAVAHEVRNPLTSIKGFTQLFEDKIEKEYTELMLSELSRIEMIINEFLTLAKPQAVNFKQENIITVLRNILSIIEAQALLNNINIETIFHAENVLINCDQNQMKQVFLNIIKNAMEAMPTGGILSVKTQITDSCLEIGITDEGVGIPPERIQRLGEPFFSNKEKGTGLGLMVCFKILEDHDGRIDINSVEGQGTTVTIKLPLQEE